MPAVQENSDMMVPMQKDERLFVDDDEECVDELTEVFFDDIVMSNRIMV